MNGKSPISALQELMAARKLPAPVYIEEPFGTSFKCTVFASGLTGIGISTTKKDAKHKSANNILDQMLSSASNLVVRKANSTSVSTRNYIGELNEWASKHGIIYPDYNFLNVGADGTFHIKCIFLDKEKIGIGINKKMAKQDAAMKMLEMVKSFDTNLSLLNKFKSNSQTTDAFEIQEKAIELFKSFSLNTRTNSEINKAFIDNNINLSTDIDSSDDIEQLKKKLEETGMSYTLKELQSKPCYVLSLQIKDTDLCFVGCGADRTEAMKNAFRNVLEVCKSGCPLTNDLISFS